MFKLTAPTKIQKRQYSAGAVCVIPSRIARLSPTHSAKHILGEISNHEESHECNAYDIPKIGNRVEVFWYKDQKYYSGTVETSNSKSNQPSKAQRIVTILYDNGDKRKRDLDSTTDKDTIHSVVQGGTRLPRFMLCAMATQRDIKYTKPVSEAVSNEKCNQYKRCTDCVVADTRWPRHAIRSVYTTQKRTGINYHSCRVINVHQEGDVTGHTDAGTVTNEDMELQNCLGQIVAL